MQQEERGRRLHGIGNRRRPQSCPLKAGLPGGPQCRPRPYTNGKIYSPLFQIHHPTPLPFLARQQALVRDANRRHASLVLPLAGRSCLYKFNHPHYYFECRLLALQWLRAGNEFRCGST